MQESSAVHTKDKSYDNTSFWYTGPVINTKQKRYVLIDEPFLWLWHSSSDRLTVIKLE